MASISQLTEEERNFTRYFFLNFKVSPEIVRQYFDGVFPPKHLSQTINSSMKTIIKLKGKKRINAAQLEILRGVTGTVWPQYLPPMPVGTKPTSSKDFDLTLMICLLRNLVGLLKPSNGWDQLPHPNDTLPGAHLATLKWYRNQLAHTTVTAMNNNEFTKQWSQVEKALASLNKGHRPHEVDEILNYDLDGEQAKLLANAELNQLKTEYEKEKAQIESVFSHYKEGNLPKNIADANAILVETWKKDDNSFYDTKGSAFVYDKVKEFNCILVTSSSGLGKTATIRHVALKLQLEEFEIVSVESPEDIINYKTNKKQVFLIDDVLGIYDLDPKYLDRWERINEKLISCLLKDSGSHKILCTLRSQIALNKRFKNASTILNQKVINLEHKPHALSKTEKQTILIKHLMTNNLDKKITPEEVEIMCESNFAFPLLCKLVSNDEERFINRIVFFRKPMALLVKELDKMINENKKLYCILVLCMLFNGSLRRGIFDFESKFDTVIKKIMQACGLETNMSKKELEDSALSALGSYFSTDSNSFWFIHDALEETVSWHFYNFNRKAMLSHCNILFIRDRVRFYSVTNMNENVDENIVIIREDELNDDCLTPLFDRLSNELSSGRFSNLLMSQLFRNKKFIRIFGTKESKKSFFKMRSSERHYSHLSRQMDPFDTDQSVRERISIKEIILSNKEFLDNNDAISRVIEGSYSRCTLMYWIVAFGCNEFFQYVWSKMSHFEHKQILGRDFLFNPLGKSFFPLAVLGGSLDIVNKLICTGADVNCFSEFWETPLYLAVKSGNLNMVDLLLKHGALVNLRGWFAMNIPITVTSNKPELTSLILAYDLNQTKLHEAVRNNNLNKLRSNIQSENIDSKTNSGWTVLHYAVILNNLEAVKFLFSKELTPNVESNFEFTHDEQRELEYRKPTPKVNIADNNGLTSVHLAVMNNYIDVLSLLLRNKADVMARDVFDRTPLHYTTSKSVTTKLLAYSSQNQSLKTNQEKTSISACRTLCFNITLKSSFRNIRRDLVNMPDREGNTPLHSVIKKCRFIEESIDCIDTLKENGANPYLLNDSWTSALELAKTSNATGIHIYKGARYKQLIKTYKVFSSVMFFLMVMTFGLSLYLSNVIRKESQNALVCVGQVPESGHFTLVYAERSLNVIFITFGLFWLSSITFNMRYSEPLRFCFYLFLILIILGCVFLILFGAFVIVQTVNWFMYSMIMIVFLFLMLMKIVPAFSLKRKILYWKKGYFFFPISYLIPQILIYTLVILTCRKGIQQLDDRYSNRDINTLNIAAANCTEFMFVNISCTSFANNIIYKNGADFSVQCLTDPRYNVTYGTLTMESGFADFSEIGLVFLLCLNLSLHATFVISFVLCISIVFKKTACIELIADDKGIAFCMSGVLIYIYMYLF